MLYRILLSTLTLLLLLTLAAQAEQTQDVFYGTQTPGPFTLSWKRIAAGTETVRINSLPQTRGLDYTLDADAGTLTLTRPLPPQSAVEVRYEYDAGHAQRQNAALSIPLAWDLARTQNGSLSLNALYHGTASGSNASPGALTVSLGGDWKTDKNQLTTKLLFAPALSSPDAPPAANGWERLGMSLTGATNVTSLARFSFGYTRAGVGLGATAGENGMQAGTQTWTLGSRLTPSRQLTTVIDYTQSDPVGDNQGKASARLATAITYAPAPTLQLQTHWTQSSAGQDADVSLSANPNATTQLGVAFTTKNAPGDAGDSQAMTLSAKAAPAKAVSLEAHLGQTSSDNGGTTQTTDVKVNAAPSAVSHVEAAYSSRNAAGETGDTQAINLAAAITPGKTLSVTAAAAQTRQGSASVDRQEVSVALNPRPELQLQTGLVLKQTNQFETTTATIGATAHPTSFLQVSGAYRDRNAPVADTALSDTLDTATAKVTLTPISGLRLTGTYAQNPDTNGSDPQPLAQRGVGLETSLGSLSLTGGYDWSCQGESATLGTALHLGVGLRLSRALQLTGGYKQTLTGLGDSATGASLYTVGLTHNLGDRFNLSMTGTKTQPLGPANAATPDYTANANLGMKF